MSGNRTDKASCRKLSGAAEAAVQARDLLMETDSHAQLLAR